MEAMTPSFDPRVGGPDSDPQLPALIPLHRVPDLVPSSQPGKRLALSTVFRWALQGRLRTVKVGGGRYVTAADLLAFVRGPSRAGEPPAADARKAGEQLDRALGQRRRPQFPSGGAADARRGAGGGRPASGGRRNPGHRTPAEANAI
jgi:hypothetical protein